MTKIKVTRQHIRNGQSMLTACPIALALKEHVWKDVFVGVGHRDVYFGSSDTRVNVPLSKRARKFVKDFDSGKKVVPSVFVVDIPDEMEVY